MKRKMRIFTALLVAIVFLLTQVFSVFAAESQAVSSWGSKVYAPYVDTSIGGFSPSKCMSLTGQKYFTFAFVLSDVKGNPAWGGSTPVDESLTSPATLVELKRIEGEISKIRAAGGDVIVSFGGSNGTELALSTKDEVTLQAKYQSVIDKYKLTWIDFDIEGGAVADAASIERRNKAIVGLQKNNPGLNVAFCLPVLPRGLTANGVKLLKSAVDNGVRIDAVNVMTMDYGDLVAPSPEGNMGNYAILAAQATYAQCHDLGIETKIGVTPMIGVNDVSSEVFYQEDAKTVLNWAESTSWARLVAMWSCARDNGSGTGVSPLCSGLKQPNFDFVNTFKAFSSTSSSAVNQAVSLAVDSIDNYGKYTVTATVPKGNEATNVKIFEGNNLIKEAAVNANSLSDQTILYEAIYKDPKTYTYRCELYNGTEILSISNIIMVTVKSAPASLTVDKAKNTGNYVITAAVPERNAATKMKLYEGSQVVLEKDLTQNSSDVQTTLYTLTGKAPGYYSYKCELIKNTQVLAQSNLSVSVVDPLTLKPSNPCLSHDNWDGDGNYNITMNMWYGYNGTSWKLYEDGTVIKSGTLPDNTPSAQTVTVPVSDKANGTYAYKFDLINENGTTSSSELKVSVSKGTSAPLTGVTDKPAVPALTASSLTNAGSYTVDCKISSGNNATSWILYENNTAVKNGTLTDNTPNNQTVSISYSGKAEGTYVYKFEFTNKFGTVISSEITVTVKADSTPPSEAKPSWTPGTSYKVGDLVTYNNKTYKCRQSHKAIVSWEPDKTLALWLPQ